jgi:hypothetical protein
MTLGITNQEQDFLLELLKTKRDSMLHELHHTDTKDYKQLLLRKLELLEGLLGKIQAETGSHVA